MAFGKVCIIMSELFHRKDRCRERHGHTVADKKFDDQVRQINSSEVYIVSGCHSLETSADVTNIHRIDRKGQLPSPEGRAGGACTTALSSILYISHNKRKGKDYTNEFDGTSGTEEFGNDGGNHYDPRSAGLSGRENLEYDNGFRVYNESNLDGGIYGFNVDNYTGDARCGETDCDGCDAVALLYES